jgi:hypothetical protein
MIATLLPEAKLVLILVTVPVPPDAILAAVLLYPQTAVSALITMP